MRDFGLGFDSLGINFAVGPKDVAIRGNFCTVDANGVITDRRAGRPANERCQAMCQKLKQIKVSGLVRAAADRAGLKGVVTP